MSGTIVKPQVLLRLGQQCHFEYERACYSQVSNSLLGLLGLWCGCSLANHGKLGIHIQSDRLTSLPDCIYVQGWRNLVHQLKGILNIWITGIPLCEQKWLEVKKKPKTHAIEINPWKSDPSLVFYKGWYKSLQEPINAVLVHFEVFPDWVKIHSICRAYQQAWLAES